MLRAIAGLLPVTSGVVRVGGADITHLPPHRRDVGVVFQHYALFPHLSVERNVAFGLEMRRLPRDEVRERVGYGLRTAATHQRLAPQGAVQVGPRDTQLLHTGFLHAAQHGVAGGLAGGGLHAAALVEVHAPVGISAGA